MNERTTHNGEFFDFSSDVEHSDYRKPNSRSMGSISESSASELPEDSEKELIKYENPQRYKTRHKVSVFDVAAYILKKLGPVSAMKLQKLVYYCQAWSLVWDEKPLFEEQIEAWANGPVVRKLFYYHRGRFELDSITVGNPDLLTEQQKDTVDAVLEFYGDKSAQWLIDLSHMEEPWKSTRAGLAPESRCRKVIPLDLIADYYSSLPSE
jgi:uncharacterized phage-associated protein